MAHDKPPTLRRRLFTIASALSLLLCLATIALWLGHESVETTQIYLHADLQMKEAARARTVPLDVARGRYRPDDQLLVFLEAL